MEPQKFSPIPLWNNVIVHRHAAPTETAGGLAIPDQHLQKPLRGTVLAVSASIYFGPRSGVEVGAAVLFGRYAGMELPEEIGKDLIALRMEEIVCVLRAIPAHPQEQPTEDEPEVEPEPVPA